MPLCPPTTALNLKDGDTVVLVCEQSGTCYAVAPATTDEGAFSELFLSSTPGRSVLGSSAACPLALQLEVVQQGEYCGLRSPALGGLYLQARKKPPHYIFFSSRLGVWEQWKVEPLYQGVLQSHNPVLSITSRQLATACLTVRAIRVGNTAASPPTRQPRVSGGGDAPAQGAPEAAPSLQDEALELSRHVVTGYITRVLKWPMFLTFRLWRQHAREQRRTRRAATERREHWLWQTGMAAMQTYAAQGRHKRHMQVLAGQLHRRHVGRRMQQILIRWFRYARGQRSWRLVLACGQQRVAAVRLRMAFHGWAAVASSTRSRTFALRQRLSWRLLRRVFTAWQQAMAGQSAALDAVQHLALRTAHGLLHACFAEWRLAVRRKRALLERGALLALHCEQRQQAVVLAAWQSIVWQLAERRRHADVAFLVRTAHRKKDALHAWRQAAALGAVLRRLALQLGARTARGLLQAAFRAWCQAVRPAAAASGGVPYDSVVSMQLQLRSRALLARVFAAWRAEALQQAQMRRVGLMLAQRCCRMVLRRALAGWAKHARLAGLAYERLLEALRQRLLRRMLRSWHGAAAGRRRLQRLTAYAFSRCRRALLALAFQAWQEQAQPPAQQVEQAMATHMQRLGRRALTGWRHVLSRKRAAIATLVGTRQRSERLLLRAAWQGMRWWAARQGAVQQHTQQLRGRTAWRVLRAWRAAAQSGRRRRCGGRVLQERVRRHRMLWVLRAWHGLACASCTRRRLVDAAATGGSSLAAAAAAALRDGLSLRYAPPTITQALPLLSALLARRCQSAARVALRAWRALAARRRMVHLAGLRTAAARQGRLAALCLKAWRAALAATWARRGKALELGAQLLRRQAGRALRAWQQYGREQRQRLRTCAVLMAARTGRRLRSIFAAWRAQATRGRWCRRQALQLRADGRGRLMAKVLAGLRLAAERTRQAEGVAGMRYSRCLRQLQSQVLHAWRQLTAAHGQYASLCHRLLSAAAGRRLLRRVLWAWQEAAGDERLCRQKWPLTCSIFYAWLSLAQQRVADGGPRACDQPCSEPEQEQEDTTQTDAGTSLRSSPARRFRFNLGRSARTSASSFAAGISPYQAGLTSDEDAGAEGGCHGAKRRAQQAAGSRRSSVSAVPAAPVGLRPATAGGSRQAAEPSRQAAAAPAGQAAAPAGQGAARTGELAMVDGSGSSAQGTGPVAIGVPLLPWQQAAMLPGMMLPAALGHHGHSHNHGHSGLQVVALDDDPGVGGAGTHRGYPTHGHYGSSSAAVMLQSPDVIELQERVQMLEGRLQQRDAASPTAAEPAALRDGCTASPSPVAAAPASGGASATQATTGAQSGSATPTEAAAAAASVAPSVAEALHGILQMVRATGASTAPSSRDDSPAPSAPRLPPPPPPPVPPPPVPAAPRTSMSNVTSATSRPVAGPVYQINGSDGRPAQAGTVESLPGPSGTPPTPPASSGSTAPSPLPAAASIAPVPAGEAPLPPLHPGQLAGSTFNLVLHAAAPGQHPHQHPQLLPPYGGSAPSAIITEMVSGANSPSVGRPDLAPEQRAAIQEALEAGNHELEALLEQMARDQGRGAGSTDAQRRWAGHVVALLQGRGMSARTSADDVAAGAAASEQDAAWVVLQQLLALRPLPPQQQLVAGMAQQGQAAALGRAAPSRLGNPALNHVASASIPPAHAGHSYPDGAGSASTRSSGGSPMESALAVLPPGAEGPTRRAVAQVPASVAAETTTWQGGAPDMDREISLGGAAFPPPAQAAQQQQQWPLPEPSGAAATASTAQAAAGNQPAAYFQWPGHLAAAPVPGQSGGSSPQHLLPPAAWMQPTAPAAPGSQPQGYLPAPAHAAAPTSQQPLGAPPPQQMMSDGGNGIAAMLPVAAPVPAAVPRGPAAVPLAVAQQPAPGDAYSHLGAHAAWDQPQLAAGPGSTVGGGGASPAYLPVPLQGAEAFTLPGPGQSLNQQSPPQVLPPHAHGAAPGLQMQQQQQHIPAASAQGGSASAPGMSSPDAARRARIGNRRRSASNLPGSYTSASGAGLGGGGGILHGVGMAAPLAILHPPAPDPAAFEDLFAQLEARSRSAMSAATAALSGQGPPSPGRRASAVVGPGPRSLDDIDRLRVRATTLSAPGAPVYGAGASVSGMLQPQQQELLLQRAMALQDQLPGLTAALAAQQQAQFGIAAVAAQPQQAAGRDGVSLLGGPLRCVDSWVGGSGAAVAGAGSLQGAMQAGGLLAASGSGEFGPQPVQDGPMLPGRRHASMPGSPRNAAPRRVSRTSDGGLPLEPPLLPLPYPAAVQAGAMGSPRLWDVGRADAETQAGVPGAGSAEAQQQQSWQSQQPEQQHPGPPTARRQVLRAAAPAAAPRQRAAASAQDLLATFMPVAERALRAAAQQHLAGQGLPQHPHPQQQQRPQTAGGARLVACVPSPRRRGSSAAVCDVTVEGGGNGSGRAASRDAIVMRVVLTPDGLPPGHGNSRDGGDVDELGRALELDDGTSSVCSTTSSSLPPRSPARKSARIYVGHYEGDEREGGAHQPPGERQRQASAPAAGPRASPPRRRREDSPRGGPRDGSAAAPAQAPTGHGGAAGVEQRQLLAELQERIGRVQQSREHELAALRADDAMRRLQARAAAAAAPPEDLGAGLDPGVSRPAGDPDAVDALDYAAMLARVKGCSHLASVLSSLPPDPTAHLRPPSPAGGAPGSGRARAAAALLSAEAACGCGGDPARCTTGCAAAMAAAAAGARRARTGIDGSVGGTALGDPLGMPLRGLLGQCEQLQHAAASRQERAGALVQAVEARMSPARPGAAPLSPRSAVASALAVLDAVGAGKRGPVRPAVRR